MEISRQCHDMLVCHHGYSLVSLVSDYGVGEIVEHPESAVAIEPGKEDP